MPYSARVIAGFTSILATSYINVEIEQDFVTFCLISQLKRVLCLPMMPRGLVSCQFVLDLLELYNLIALCSNTST